MFQDKAALGRCSSEKQLDPPLAGAGLLPVDVFAKFHTLHILAGKDKRN